VTLRKAVTWILVTLGVLASIAADAGYLVLIPLGAAAFLSPAGIRWPDCRRHLPGLLPYSVSIF